MRACEGLMGGEVEADKARRRSVDGLHQIATDVICVLRILRCQCRTDSRSLSEDRLGYVFIEDSGLDYSQRLQILFKQNIEVIGTPLLQNRVGHIHLVIAFMRS